MAKQAKRSNPKYKLIYVMRSGDEVEQGVTYRTVKEAKEDVKSRNQFANLAGGRYSFGEI